MAVDRTLAPISDPMTSTTAAPAASGAPSLGYGNQNSADLNTVNQWMRSQPWYQDYLRSQGIDPNNVHLNDGQKQNIVKLAQAHGIIVDEGHNGQQVDDSGNFQAKSNLGRNIAIGVGIGALGLTGLGLAGLGPLGGALGLGGGAADAGAAAGGSGLGAGAGAGAVDGVATAAEGATGGGSILGAAGTAAGGIGGKSLLNTILGAAGSVGGALGAAGKGLADANTTEALLNQRQDALANQNYLAGLQGANTDLAQRKFTLTAPAQRESQAVKGDILANAKDFSYGAPTMVGNIPVPSSSGGLRPSILSDSTKSLGALIPQQQLTAQQAGDQFAPLPPVPTLTPLPQPGIGSNILNTAGTIGNLSNLLAKYNKTSSGVSS